MIKVLPDILISQIAAGEVVERPASVLKELLENSIDAGATRIEIEVEQGGQTLIAVRDNGSGMNAVDARACFLRHATSKIRELDDLQAIASFGFRGEALAAISSVAHVTLRTREHTNESGIEVIVDGGREISTQTTGCPPGTEFVVRNLFYNTPARRKFLKRESTELSHISAEINAAALVHHGVAIRFQSDGKIICDLPPNTKVKDRVAAVLGGQFANELQDVLFADMDISLAGFVAHPGASLSSRRRQYLFVNHRPVSDPAVVRAVMNAYGSRLPARMYPSFVLFLEIDPHAVDVNVHPRKSMVKFHDANRVYRAVFRAVEHALADRQHASLSVLSGSVASQKSAEFGVRYSAVVPPQKQAIQDALNFSREFVSNGASSETQVETAGEESAPNVPTILAYVADSYIVIRDTDGIAFIDQHAAHERVTYERLKRAYDERRPQSQPLLIPLQLEIPGDELPLFEEALPLLTELGFEFERWSGNTFVVNACPAQIAHDRLERIICDLLSEAENESGSLKEKVSPERVLKSLACKSSVTFGMPITAHEQEALLRDLARTPNNSTCPHGRPTKVSMSFSELRNRFYRS